MIYISLNCSLSSTFLRADDVKCVCMFFFLASPFFAILFHFGRLLKCLRECKWVTALFHFIHIIHSFAPSRDRENKIHNDFYSTFNAALRIAPPMWRKNDCHAWFIDILRASFVQFALINIPNENDAKFTSGLHLLLRSQCAFLRRRRRRHCNHYHRIYVYGVLNWFIFFFFYKFWYVCVCVYLCTLSSLTHRSHFNYRCLP